MHLDDYTSLVYLKAKPYVFSKLTSRGISE